MPLRVVTTRAIMAAITQDITVATTRDTTVATRDTTTVIMAAHTTRDIMVLTTAGTGMAGMVVAMAAMGTIVGGDPPGADAAIGFAAM